MNLADIKARVARLEQLSMGLGKEIVLVQKADHPMLYLERKAYLNAMHNALTGVEKARVALVMAKQRLERAAGKFG